MKQKDVKDTPNIHLTFDDGPDQIWTPRVLEALDRARAQATFFVITPRALKNPHLIEDIQQAGHRVEFHCVEHVRHTERSRQELETDAEVGLRDLESLGVEPRLWRTPWGKLAPWTTEVADDYGLQIAPWNVDTHDWRGDTARKMLKTVKLDLRPHSIVLMHDGIGPGALRGGCEETVALIEPMVEHIRELGCEPEAMRPNSEVSV